LHKWGFLRLIFQGLTQLEQQTNTEHTIQCGPIVKSRHFKGTSRSQPLHCWGTFYGRLRAGAIQLITVYKILSRSPGFQTTCSKWFGPHCINQDSKTSPATVWRHNVSCYWRTSSFASGNYDACVDNQTSRSRGYHACFVFGGYWVQIYERTINFSFEFFSARTDTFRE